MKALRRGITERGFQTPKQQRELCRRKTRSERPGEEDESRCAQMNSGGTLGPWPPDPWTESFLLPSHYLPLSSSSQQNGFKLLVSHTHRSKPPSQHQPDPASGTCTLLRTRPCESLPLWTLCQSIAQVTRIAVTRRNSVTMA